MDGKIKFILSSFLVAFFAFFGYSFACSSGFEEVGSECFKYSDPVTAIQVKETPSYNSDCLNVDIGKFVCKKSSNTGFIFTFYTYDLKNNSFVLEKTSPLVVSSVNSTLFLYQDYEKVIYSVGNHLYVHLFSSKEEKYLGNVHFRQSLRNNYFVIDGGFFYSLEGDGAEVFKRYDIKNGSISNVFMYFDGYPVVHAKEHNFALEVLKNVPKYKVDREKIIGDSHMTYNKNLKNIYYTPASDCIYYKLDDKVEGFCFNSGSDDFIGLSYKSGSLNIKKYSKKLDGVLLFPYENAFGCNGGFKYYDGKQSYDLVDNCYGFPSTSKINIVYLSKTDKGSLVLGVVSNSKIYKLSLESQSLNNSSGDSSDDIGVADFGSDFGNFLSSYIIDFIQGFNISLDLKKPNLFICSKNDKEKTDEEACGTCEIGLCKKCLGVGLNKYEYEDLKKSCPNEKKDIEDKTDFGGGTYSGDSFSGFNGVSPIGSLKTCTNPTLKNFSEYFDFSGGFVDDITSVLVGLKNLVVDVFKSIVEFFELIGRFFLSIFVSDSTQSSDAFDLKSLAFKDVDYIESVIEKYQDGIPFTFGMLSIGKKVQEGTYEITGKLGKSFFGDLKYDDNKSKVIASYNLKILAIGLYFFDLILASVLVVASVFYFIRFKDDF